MTNEVFRRKANRLGVFLKGGGFVPVATSLDDTPVLLTAAPRRIGDDALIDVEGKVRKVRLLESTNNYTYLVDMGPA